MVSELELPSKFPHQVTVVVEARQNVEKPEFFL